MINKVRKCIFPVAGYGTRFLPATKSMPKEMLPIVNKPIVQYGVEEAIQAGMKNVTFVTGRGKRSIADHFDVSYELEHQIAGTSKEKQLECIRSLIATGKFSFIRQNYMGGLGHAILTAEPLVGDEAFGVVLADDLCVNDHQGVMAQMSALYEKYRCTIVAIEEVPFEEAHKYGVVAVESMQDRDDLFRVTDMVEKPEPGSEPSNLAIIGRYILTPDIFELIRATPSGKNGEVQITDALLQQAKDGCVLAYRFKGKRFDCGSVDGYVAATNYVYQKMV
ncbi:MAG: UTP--glucose-1-phosphate uridylyltransferase [Marinomonas sp.]|nr:MAG: UTP--glucose-1-phosphate uridylyltransferase [Marinomonas sp.]